MTEDYENGSGDTDSSVLTEEEVSANGSKANADKPWLFTKENAAEYGRRGGKKSRSGHSPRTLESIRKNKDELFNALYQAAMGRGENWQDLPAEKRLGALKLLLEYVEGRPTPRKEGDGEPTQEDGGGWEIGEAEE